MTGCARRAPTNAGCSNAIGHDGHRSFNHNLRAARIEGRMKKLIAVGALVAGGIIAFRSLPRVPRRRLAAAVSRRMLQRMEHMMASLPENSPPKLIVSVLPRLRDQNEQMIAMLRDQNELLRTQLGTRRDASGRAS
jgi:hypothetical protein